MSSALHGSEPIRTASCATRLASPPGTFDTRQALMSKSAAPGKQVMGAFVNTALPRTWGCIPLHVCRRQTCQGDGHDEHRQGIFGLAAS